MQKQPNPVFSFAFALLLLSTFAAACNNNADEKKDTPAVDTPARIAPDTLQKVDTMKMDTTAATKPIKTT